MLYNLLNVVYLAGAFRGAGGEGGSDAEPGGPGTIYLHLLPEDGADPLLDATVYVVTHDSNHTGVFSNRTLYIDNRLVQLMTAIARVYFPIVRYTSTTGSYIK